MSKSITEYSSRDLLEAIAEAEMKVKSLHVLYCTLRDFNSVGELWQANIAYKLYKGAIERLGHLWNDYFYFLKRCRKGVVKMAKSEML